MKEDGIRALAVLDCPELKELNLSDNCIGLRRDGRHGYEGLRALAAAGLLRNLTDLDVSHNALDADGLAALVGGPAFSRLAALNLAETDLDGGAVRRLAGVDSLHNLQILNLSGNVIGVGGARAVRSPRTFRG